jgi:hypothetical protein
LGHLGARGDGTLNDVDDALSRVTVTAPQHDRCGFKRRLNPHQDIHVDCTVLVLGHAHAASSSSRGPPAPPTLEPRLARRPWRLQHRCVDDDDVHVSSHYGLGYNDEMLPLDADADGRKYIKFIPATDAAGSVNTAL